MSADPKETDAYLVEFFHNKGAESVHLICFFEIGSGWCNNIPQCCLCNDIPRDYDMSYAIGWRKLPTMLDDLKRIKE